MSPAMEGTVLVVGGTALMFIIGAGKEMGGLRVAVARSPGQASVPWHLS